MFLFFPGPHPDHGRGDPLIPLGVHRVVGYVRLEHEEDFVAVVGQFVDGQEMFEADRAADQPRGYLQRDEQSPAHHVGQGEGAKVVVPAQGGQTELYTVGRPVIR